MRNQKNERGITLVALVVTIVVLLILAGITIMYVMSDNGVFGKAQQAKTETNKALVKDAVSVTLGDLYAEIYAPSQNTDGSNKTLTEVFKSDLPKTMKIVDETGADDADFAIKAASTASELKINCYIKYDVDGLVYKVDYSKDAFTVGDGQKATATTPGA